MAVSGKESFDYLVKLNESNRLRMRLFDHTGETLLDEVRTAVKIADKLVTSE